MQKDGARGGAERGLGLLLLLCAAANQIANRAKTEIQHTTSRVAESRVRKKKTPRKTKRWICGLTFWYRKYCRLYFDLLA
jgi:hypothetical protein